MGRPLNKKYFGNRNVGAASPTDDGIGGNSVASVTLGGTWSGFTLATTTVTFSAPTLPNGTRATGVAVIDGSNNITSITITNGGSGYVTAPTVTIVDSDVGAETTGTATAVLAVDTGAVGSSTNRENAIVAYAYTGGSLVPVDIQKQISSKRYRVNANGEVSTSGTEIACIRYDAVADGTKGYSATQGVELNIVAIDSDGGTYLVRKLTNHKVSINPMAISRLSSSAGTQFALNGDGTTQSVPWTFGAPTAGYNVKIENA